MNHLAGALAWLADPSHWGGPTGILARLWEHCWYSALALLLAAAVAIPAGLFIGHTGRFRGLVVPLTGALRALPTLGVLTALAVSMGLGLSQAIVPSTLALAVLAIPPLLAGAYAGVEAVDPAVVDGARATGLTGRQVVLGVELPLAAPLIIGGVRAAALQVIATATISAYLGLGGLGRFILDGQAVGNYPLMLAGAVLVVALALVTDAVAALLQRWLTPKGVRVALAAA